MYGSFEANQDAGQSNYTWNGPKTQSPNPGNPFEAAKEPSALSWRDREGATSINYGTRKREASPPGPQSWRAGGSQQRTDTRYEDRGIQDGFNQKSQPQKSHRPVRRDEFSVMSSKDGLDRRSRVSPPRAPPPQDSQRYMEDRDCDAGANFRPSSPCIDTRPTDLVDPAQLNWRCAPQRTDSDRLPQEPKPLFPVQDFDGRRSPGPAPLVLDRAEPNSRDQQQQLEILSWRASQRHKDDNNPTPRRISPPPPIDEKRDRGRSPLSHVPDRGVYPDRGFGNRLASPVASRGELLDILGNRVASPVSSRADGSRNRTRSPPRRSPVATSNRSRSPRRSSSPSRDSRHERNRSPRPLIQPTDEPRELSWRSTQPSINSSNNRREESVPTPLFPHAGKDDPSTGPLEATDLHWRSRPIAGGPVHSSEARSLPAVEDERVADIASLSWRVAQPARAPDTSSLSWRQAPRVNIDSQPAPLMGAFNIDVSKEPIPLMATVQDSTSDSLELSWRTAKVVAEPPAPLMQSIQDPPQELSALSWRNAQAGLSVKPPSQTVEPALSWRLSQGGTRIDPKPLCQTEAVNAPDPGLSWRAVQLGKLLPEAVPVPISFIQNLGQLAASKPLPQGWRSSQSESSNRDNRRGLSSGSGRAKENSKKPNREDGQSGGESERRKSSDNNRSDEKSKSRSKVRDEVDVKETDEPESRETEETLVEETPNEDLSNAFF